MDLSNLDYALWAASLVGHVALVFVLVVRHRLRTVPVFSAFIAFAAIRTVLLFFVYRYGSSHRYFQVYWITGVTNYLFQVALITEIALNVLRPAGHWVLQARRSFFLWALLGLVAAAMLTDGMGATQSRGLDLWETRLTVFTSLLTCGLFLAMATAANRLGLRWRSHFFAIGQGLFLWAFITLLENAGHAALGWNRNFILLDHVRMFSYLAVLIFWSVSFWTRNNDQQTISPEAHAFLVAAHHRLEYDLSRVDRNQP